MQYPLSGVRVVEFGHVAAGPFTGMLLADLGADVVKVEGPDGDQMRGWPPVAAAADGERFSFNFAALNRNKRSVQADLRDEVQAASVASLCAAADVVVENYRPGALDKFGLGYEALASTHRGLVYCSVSGFGRTSPYAAQGAYDVVIQAMSGLMSITGDPEGMPAKSGVPVADFIAGLYAAFSITASLPTVRSAGRSILLDCPMLDCLVAASALQTSEYWGTGVDPGRLGSRHPRNAPYQAFPSSDGAFALAAGSQKLWFEVCDAIGRDDLRSDLRFATQQARAANQLELSATLSEDFELKPTAYWLEEFGRRGVPCGNVNSIGEMLADDHIKQSHLVHRLATPVLGDTPVTVFPVRMGDLPPRLERGAPRLGEHTNEVFREWLGKC